MKVLVNLGEIRPATIPPTSYQKEVRNHEAENRKQEAGIFKTIHKLTPSITTNLIYIIINSEVNNLKR